MNYKLIAVIALLCIAESFFEASATAGGHDNKQKHSDHKDKDSDRHREPKKTDDDGKRHNEVHHSSKKNSSTTHSSEENSEKLNLGSVFNLPGLNNRTGGEQPPNCEPEPEPEPEPTCSCAAEEFKILMDAYIGCSDDLKAELQKHNQSCVGDPYTEMKELLEEFTTIIIEFGWKIYIEMQEDECEKAYDELAQLTVEIQSYQEDIQPMFAKLDETVQSLLIAIRDSWKLDEKQEACANKLAECPEK